MSFEDVQTALMARLPEAEGIEPSTMKIVLIAIAQHTNGRRNDHRAWPAMDRLAVMTGLAVSAVSRAVDALDKVGAFKQRVHGGGRQRSEYVLDVAKLGGWGIDWLGSSREPSDKAKEGGFLERTQPSWGEPSPPPAELSLPSREPSHPPEEPNKVLNLGFNTGFEPRSRTSPGSLRSPGAAAAPPVATPARKDKGENQNREPKGSGASGVSPNQDPKPKAGTQIAAPWRRSKPCSKCGDAMYRDEPHACKAKAMPPSDYMREIEGDDPLTENQRKYGNILGVEPL